MHAAFLCLPTQVIAEQELAHVLLHSSDESSSDNGEEGEQKEPSHTSICALALACFELWLARHKAHGLSADTCDPAAVDGCMVMLKVRVCVKG